MSDDTAMTMASTPPLAASYARKSKEHALGVPAQHVTNEQTAAADGFLIPDSPAFRFEDDDTPGTTTSRHGFDRLMAVVRSGNAPFKRIYVPDVTRHGRWGDTRYGTWLEVEAERYGVEFRYSEEAVHPDFSQGITPETLGPAVKRFFDRVMASEERTRLIKRVTRGLRYHVLRGFFPGARAPYGTERWLADLRTGSLLQRVPDTGTIRQEGCSYKLAWIDGEPTRVVQDIFRWIESGQSLASIATELNRRGVPPPVPAGRWAKEVVRKIARNPIYCGDLVWGRTTREGEPTPSSDAELEGKTAILVRDFLPGAPIDRERFEYVRGVLRGNRQRWDRRKATKPQYLLSGLVTCQECGGAWHGFTSTKAEATRRRYYRHVSKRGSECPSHGRYVRAEPLENAVLDHVAGILENDTLRKLVERSLADRLRDCGSEARDREIQGIERDLRRKSEALQRAAYGSATTESDAERKAFQLVHESLGKEIGALNSRLGSLRVERELIESLIQRTTAVQSRVENLRTVLETGSPNDRKELIAALVPCIGVPASFDTITIDVRAL